MSHRILFTLFAAIVTSSLFLNLGPRVQAQYAGDNAVFNSTNTQTYSHSFIDASKVPGSNSNSDLCARVNAALNNLADTVGHSGYGSATAAVIDARGTSTASACSQSPWGSPSPTVWPGATILLPAGTIAITAQWTLPNGTRVIGQGTGGVFVSGATSTTIIQAETGFPGGSPMIQMGSTSTAWCPSTGCAAVSVEDLTLDGNGKATMGIVNGQSQNYSFVRRVNFYQFSGISLKVYNNAQNSGPYTDLGCSLGSVTPGTGTFCAQILNIATHGIHGMTVVGPSTAATTAAILLDAPNNTLEDIHIQGFQTGIAIGTNAAATNPAQSDVLLNITGGAGVTKLIHISSTKPPSDLTLMAINNTNGSGTTIQDDLVLSTISDASVALYALGEKLTSGTHTVYSRFTTSKSQPSWAVGTTPPTGCTDGSIFSSTSGSGGSYLFVCRSGVWTGL